MLEAYERYQVSHEEMLTLRAGGYVLVGFS